MKSVIDNEYVLVIKNSKFIGVICSVHNEMEIKTKLEEIKIKYPDATHYCYAYILDHLKRESDDGEPSGTAGIPMLQVLEKNNLNYVLCIVVRYFGKIKLGAGGLVRAYTKVVTCCLKDHMISLVKGYFIKIMFPYSLLKNIDYLLQGSQIVLKQFNDSVFYQVYVSEELFNTLIHMYQDIEIEVLEHTFISL